MTTNPGVSVALAQTKSDVLIGKEQIRAVTTKCIGLIGGLALRAGVFYYEQLLNRFNDRGETLDLLLKHADVKQVLAAIMSGDKSALGKYLGSIANHLFAGGADMVAVTASAPHLAIDELVAESRGLIVNVLGTIVSGLETAGLKRVAIFGNRAVMQTNIFGVIREDRVIKLDPSRLDAVHTMYNDIALSGKRGTANEVDFLNMVAKEAITKGGAEAIVLAGTDLSSFYAQTKPEFPYLDVAALHINQIVSMASGR